MNISIDKRTNSTKIVDSQLLEYVVSNELIRANATVLPNEDIIAKIIASNNNLNPSSKDFYLATLTIMRHNNIKINESIDVKEVIDYCKKIHFKSDRTYKRAIEELVKKGIIKYDTNKRGVIVIAKYNTCDINYSVIKSIVINIK